MSDQEHPDGIGKIRLYVEWSGGRQPVYTPGWDWYRSGETEVSAEMDVPGPGRLDTAQVNRVIQRHLLAAAEELNGAARTKEEDRHQVVSHAVARALLPGPEEHFAEAREAIKKQLRSIHRYPEAMAQLLEFLRTGDQVAEIKRMREAERS